MILLFLVLVTLVAIFLLATAPIKHKPSDNYIVTVLASSKSTVDNSVLTSFYLRYPRFIHSEMMTHKDFSRSASSSRAIPVKKVLSQVWNNPAMPIQWGTNKPGMQAGVDLYGWKETLAYNIWINAGRLVCVFVWLLVKLNVHKQLANRLLEPWQFMHVTLTSVNWNNFFNLRIHPDAQPEIYFLASMMYQKLVESTPMELDPDEYHLPWIKHSDYKNVVEFLYRLNDREPINTEISALLLKISAARCARSSYANFTGLASIDKDLETFDKLVKSKPVHASPCEHQATPDERTETGSYKNQDKHGNLPGWVQHRHTIPDHYLKG